MTDCACDDMGAKGWCGRRQPAVLAIRWEGEHSLQLFQAFLDEKWMKLQTWVF